MSGTLRCLLGGLCTLPWDAPAWLQPYGPAISICLYLDCKDGIIRGTKQ